MIPIKQGRMFIVKYSFLNFRDRPVQLFIFGLMFLSLFIYHYATSSDIYQMPVSITNRRSPGHVGRSILNTSGKVQNSLPPTNTVAQNLEPENISTSENAIMPQLGSTLSTSSVDGEPSESQTVAESRRNFQDGSVGAIYPGGHSVRIPEKCPDFGIRLKLMIVIMSAPSNEMARKGIRQTWGHYDQRNDVSIAFILGDTNDTKVESALVAEQEMYGDIIRGNFIDSYTNLTLKTVSTLEWVTNYCSEAKFVLKTDDDMFINVPRLLTFIERRSTEKNVIYGRLARGWKPVRDKKSKYYMSQKEWKPKEFPQFTTGPAYLLSNDVIERLFEGCLNITFFKLEDVFMTGIVANKLGIARKQADGFLNDKKSFDACNVQRSISLHMVKYSDQFDLWKKLLDGQSKCK